MGLVEFWRVEEVSMQVNLDEVEYITETSITIRGSRRRITLPKEIVHHFELEDGDRIMWILFKDDRLILVPKRTSGQSGGESIE